MIKLFLIFCLFGAGFCSEKKILREELNSQKQDKIYNFSVCTIFENEDRYLKEWIEYHLLVGVDHFYLYSNNSSDNYSEILTPYVKEGKVTLVHWPDHFKHLKEENKYLWALGTQVPAYENAAKILALKETKWLTFLEVGEFLCPAKTNTFKEVLDLYDDYPGITCTSDYYDASKLNATTGRYFLIETIELTSKPEDNQIKDVEKTIFKPEECSFFLWPPYRYVFKGNRFAVSVDREVLKVNHYAYRFNGSLFFEKIKKKLHIDNRLLPATHVKELLQLGYEIEDQECVIKRYIPEMQKKLSSNRF